MYHYIKELDIWDKEDHRINKNKTHNLKKMNKARKKFTTLNFQQMYTLEIM